MRMKTVTMKLDTGDALTRLFRKDAMAIRGILCDHEVDYDVVDELMQETFLKAWKERESFKGNSKLLTWVCQIAKNVAIDYMRSKRGEPDLVPEDVLKCADSDSYTDTLVASVPEDDPGASLEAQDTMDNAVAMMSPQQAAAVRMRLEGYSNQEIAHDLGTTEAVVRSQISQAKRYF